MEYSDDILEWACEDEDDEIYYMQEMMDDEEKKTRRPRLVRERLVWEGHVQEIERGGGFQTRYHMSLESFNHLVDILRGRVTIEPKMARVCCGQIIPPQVVVGAGLRYMGGELVKSIADIFRLSLSTTGRIIDLF